MAWEDGGTRGVSPAHQTDGKTRSGLCARSGFLFGGDFRIVGCLAEEELRTEEKMLYDLDLEGGDAADVGISGVVPSGGVVAVSSVVILISLSRLCRR